MVSITGSVESGKKVARAAADNLKRVHLELGGKAPVIIFDDADIEAAAETIKAAGYWNSGQDCTAATRVVVGPKVYDNFLSELVGQVESIKVGDPSEVEDIDMGPVVSQHQLERVLGFLERASRRGEDRHRRRRDGQPRLLRKPTVVTDAEQRSKSSRRRSSVPSSPCSGSPTMTRPSPGQRCRVRPRCLGVDRERPPRLRAVGKLQYGCVWLNDHFTVFNEMPHGGYKQSGYGKDMSKYSLEDYTTSSTSRQVRVTGAETRCLAPAGARHR